MKEQSIDIEIVEKLPGALKVKVPFLDIPVKMSTNYFEPRLKKGYFKIKPLQANDEYPKICSTRSRSN